VPEPSTPLLQLGSERMMLPVPAGPQPAERARLERRTRLLAWGGIGWHVVEFAIALAAGLAAGSIALIGFGADSLIEALAGGVVLWLFTGNRRGSSTAERRAQQLISVTFFVLAAYVGIEALRTLVSGDHPEASWVGIGLAAFTAPTMPLLAYAKRRLGNQLRSAHRQGGLADTALRLPFRRASTWAGCERTRRLVVGRPIDGARHRRRRGQGGTRELARRRLLRCLLME
jgi:hypothetical protein